MKSQKWGEPGRAIWQQSSGGLQFAAGALRQSRMRDWTPYSFQKPCLQSSLSEALPRRGYRHKPNVGELPVSLRWVGHEIVLTPKELRRFGSPLVAFRPPCPNGKGQRTSRLFAPDLPGKIPKS